MKFEPRGIGPICILTLLLLLIVSTVVSQWGGFKFSSTDLASESLNKRTPQARPVEKCVAGGADDVSLAQYFEVRQAQHFYEAIETAINSQPEGRQQLSSISFLLNAVNQELLRDDTIRRRTTINRWVEAYPGSDKFKTSTYPHVIYNLPAFYEYVEQDVHRFFNSLLQETLLPQNFWVVKRYDHILSLGVRLSENTWGRVGLYPAKWHLQIFKSAPNADGLTPKEHLPLQPFALRFIKPRHFEVVTGAGQVKLRLKSPAELELISLCELKNL